jgi:alcohol dehydrogenase class IV
MLWRTLVRSPNLNCSKMMFMISNATLLIVEALYARNANPVISLIAIEGIKALAESLPEIVKNPASESSRLRAQYGAWLCGICLGYCP